MKKKIVIVGVINLFFGGIIFILLFFMMLGGGSAAATSGNSTGGGDYSGIKQVMPAMNQQQFIDAMSKGAINTYKQYGVFASVTIAQAIQESNWGKSVISNNLFGIKADSSWTGSYIQEPTNEVYSGITVTIEANFRVYPTYEDSLMDHAKFLSENSTYKDHGVFTATTYMAQAEAIQASGYATDPNYAEELITLIKEFNLDKYDK